MKVVGQEKQKNKWELFRSGKTVTANLKKSFENLLKTYTGDEVKINELVSSVFSKYTEKHRFYHNLSHIHSLLYNAENLREEFSDDECMRLAIWFHDVIYEPKKYDNEVKSAQFAVVELTGLTFPQAKIKKVEKMILATQKHEAEGLDKDGKLFLDLDLGILGTDEKTYQNYAQAIRQEYAFVPESLYRSRRQMVLESFLHRKYIYYTGKMRELLEDRARFNIANEIKELS